MPDSRQTLDAMAAEIFELYQLVAALRSRQTRGAEELSETEYIALDILVTRGPMTIGEVQQRVGVAPARMSRIVRSLQNRGGGGFVRCSINPHDRRRIDIDITRSGREAHAKYRAARLGSMVEVLKVLPPEDRMHFMRILGQIRTAFAERLQADRGDSS